MAKKNNATHKIEISNRKASYLYHLTDKYTAGLVLPVQKLNLSVRVKPV